jgi:hypothetical protein
METQENNILIAQFMGFDFSRFENDGIMEPQEEIFFTDSKTFSVDELKFHNDWNWLMKVVEKCLIGEAEHNEDEAKKAISEIYESLCGINISAVYNACVSFIEWYNKQK